MKAVHYREDFLERLEESIKRWRSIYEREVVDGPSRQAKKEQFSSEDFLMGSRPFFASVNREDPLYTATFRAVEYSALKYSLSSKVVIMRTSGYRLGQEFVRSGLIATLEDAPLVLSLYKIGLLDIVDESLNKMRLNIYECISCYGLPNIGRTMCDFEAGVLQGILSELFGSSSVKERYCWGTGYSFCGFEVRFE